MKILTKAAPTLTKTAAPFEIKALDETKRTFRGLASTWDEDLGGDVIHPGAFRKTLDDWRASGKVLPLIDQHNYGSVRSVVGKMTEAKETKTGVEAEFEIIDGPDGDEVLRRVKGGYIDSLSIGYEAVRWEMERPEGAEPWESIRHLKELKLYEVSVVIWPMNPGAVIDPASLKSLTAALREGRLSEEQKAEIRALLSESAPQEPEEGKSPLEGDGTPAGDGAAPYEHQAALSARIRMLGLHRAARRHSVGV